MTGRRGVFAADLHSVPVSVIDLVSVLRLPADLRSLTLVRAAVDASLAREGWEDESVARVVLAAHDATANAIEHGSAPGGTVEVELALDAERAALRVADAGRPGGGAIDRPPVPPDPTGARGRGLMIMEAVSERLEVDARADGGTEVRLQFCRAA